MCAAVSSSRRKSRKAHFTAHSTLRRKLMSSHLSKELRSQYNVRSMPIRKGDEVSVMKGFYKGKGGKVTTVYRRRWCIYIEKLTKDKHNGKFITLISCAWLWAWAIGQTINVPFHPSNVKITTLKLDKDRKAILEKKKTVTKGAKVDLDWEKLNHWYNWINPKCLIPCLRHPWSLTLERSLSSFQSVSSKRTSSRPLFLIYLLFTTLNL